MDYPYENLGPERFQEFVQSLLNKEFGDVQCFPVAQPDGGRDAISFYDDDDEKGFIVYQVKYVRQPLKIEDCHKWLVDILEKEADKVKELIPKGALKYVLITNVKGTAHLDVGSIDLLQKSYDSRLGIPFIGWWRDDINRKLDNVWDLKWVYPELMTGSDLIRAILEKGISQDNGRRTSAIRAFVKDQFDQDRELRFKQVELQNNLMDLYVDVPIQSSINYNIKTKKRAQKTVGYIFKKVLLSDEVFRKDIEMRYGRAIDEEAFRYISVTENFPLGAAKFFLNSEVQKSLPMIVLEGAPGQGKSTVTQYLAQIHRIKILKNSNLKLLNDYQQKAGTRIPFRIDLRDLSIWLSKKNPFSIDNADQVSPNWQKTLESFLAAFITVFSGGIEFSVTDLIAVVEVSSILLIFDGLDEVADIKRRGEVIDEIVRGVGRMSTNAASIQVIVTSRPAVFVASTTFPEDSYHYLQLGEVSKMLVNEYTEKWIKARKLNDRDSFDVKKIIKEKIDQPHLRELTKNTMQLTILLNLIHSKGVALPDRRTALYDNYIDTFFNRESEKNIFVRQNRELLIDIHRYLAWKLHSDAELEESQSKATSGRISREALNKLLIDYLENEHYDTSIVDKLFTGMVERVVAIVSRVEGTFEFEVQPLREYFAARYLYDNASPISREGTKIERFDIICRSFYWLNVTRFYAGCYSRGELQSLVTGLKKLLSDKDYKLIGYPITLISMLLNDWVFSNNPKAVIEVVNSLMESGSLKAFLDEGTVSISSDYNAKDELLNICFSKISVKPKKDYLDNLIELARKNSDDNDLLVRWHRCFEKDENSVDF